MTLALTFIGKKGARQILSYDQAMGIAAVISEALGRKIRLDVSTEGECRVWARTLRHNNAKIRLFMHEQDQDGLGGYEFLAIQGSDIKKVVATHYRFLKPEDVPTWDMAQELDEEWETTITNFAKFLDHCGGIVRVD
jgi:hypothetical protein